MLYTAAQMIRVKIKINTPALKKKAKRKKKYKNGGELLMAMAADAERLNAKGPKDLATNPDKYLYGSE